MNKHVRDIYAKIFRFSSFCHFHFLTLLIIIIIISRRFGVILNNVPPPSSLVFLIYLLWLPKLVQFMLKHMKRRKTSARWVNLVKKRSRFYFFSGQVSMKEYRSDITTFSVSFIFALMVRFLSLSHSQTISFSQWNFTFTITNFPFSSLLSFFLRFEYVFAEMPGTQTASKNFAWKYHK